MAFKLKGSSFYGSPLAQKKGKNYESSKGDQQGPIPEKNQKLRKSEMEGTYVYEGKRKSERMNDLEDRAEFARSDAEESTGKKQKQHQKTAKHLEREADIIRDRKPKSKNANIKPGYTDGERDKSKDKIYGVKGPLGVIKK
jgi:hypothetical protein